jgi:hypothetical protein
MIQMLVHFSAGFVGATMAAWLATRCFLNESSVRSLQTAVLNSAYAGY